MTPEESRIWHKAKAILEEKKEKILYRTDCVKANICYVCGSDLKTEGDITFCSKDRSHYEDKELDSYSNC